MELPVLETDVRHWPRRLRRAAAEIVVARGGRPLAPEDLARLAAACADGERAARGVSGGGAASGLLGRRMTVGNVTLETPTLAASLLLEAVESWPPPPQWLDQPWAWRMRLEAWCCAHGRDEALIAEANGPERLVELVTQWLRGVTATDAELAAAVAEVRSAELYPPPRAGTQERLSGPDWQTVLRRLGEDGGASVREWLYETPESRAMWMLSAVNDADRAAAHDPKAPNPDDPMIDATATWKAVERELKKEQEMRKKTVDLGGGRSFEVREMSWAEFRRVRDEGEKLPFTWPLEQQIEARDAEVDDLAVSDIRRLAEAVYDLTFGGEGEGK